MKVDISDVFYCIDVINYGIPKLGIIFPGILKKKTITYLTFVLPMWCTMYPHSYPVIKPHDTIDDMYTKIPHSAGPE